MLIENFSNSLNAKTCNKASRDKLNNQRKDKKQQKYFLSITVVGVFSQAVVMSSELPMPSGPWTVPSGGV